VAASAWQAIAANSFDPLSVKKIAPTSLPADRVLAAAPLPITATALPAEFEEFPITFSFEIEALAPVTAVDVPINTLPELSMRARSVALVPKTML
jgi:hypothetical protein